MLDPIPTEVTNHSKARTDGVSSSDMLGGPRPQLLDWVSAVVALPGSQEAHYRIGTDIRSSRSQSPLAQPRSRVSTPGQ
jgi:hypothetical protein